MPYWPPDTPPSVPEQMPQVMTPGPAPVPYNGPGFAIAPDMLASVPAVSQSDMPGDGVLSGTAGANNVSEAPWAAPNVNLYAAGAPQKIYTGGDNNAAGLDDVAGSVAAAVAAAEARAGAHQQDTYAQGSRIGDLLTFASLTATGAQLDPGAAAGETEPGGAFYEPPRNYGA